MKPRLPLLLVLVTLAAAPAETYAQTVLYAEDFTGDSTSDLNGTTPDTTTDGATWIAGTRFKTDGIITAATGNHSAWIPLTPTAGNVYTVSAMIDTTAGGQNWISLGFSAAAAAMPNNRFVDDAVAGMANFLVRQNRGGGTGATDVQFFTGEDTQGLTSIANPPTGVVTARITLDASDPDAANWTTSFSVNGTEIPLSISTILDGPDAGTDVSYANIRWVGFTLANANVEGTIDNFKVEVTSGGPNAGPPFEITRIEPIGTLGTPGAIARITFNSRVGRNYILQYSENLQDWFDTEIDFFTATAESSTLDETLAAANFPDVFYHVRESSTP